MIVVCPKCSKRFALDETLLPPEGRQVRCTACYHVWKQLPENPPFSQVPPLLDFTLSHTTGAPHRFVKKRSKWIGTVVLLAIFIVLVNILVFGRHVIIALWPASEKGYALIGLSRNKVNHEFSIYNVTPKLYRRGNIDMLVISGNIKNTSTQARPVSSLKIKILGAGPQEKAPLVDHWEHDLSTTYLLPGEIISFETAPRPKATEGKTIALEF